ncbi:MAG: hypothetical protein IKM45_01105 [Opitutales bacterium]|nr:hypothetical protein [Opitutales bacterium]
MYFSKKIKLLLKMSLSSPFCRVRILSMAKTSKMIGCTLQEEVLYEADKFLSRKELSAFIRIAFIEKLNRDFGTNLNPQKYIGGRGARFDMSTEKGRAKALNQLAKARSKISKNAEKSAKKYAKSGNLGMTPLRNARITEDGNLVPVLQKKSTVTNIFRKTSD